MATIYDVAEKAQVSIATVSRVLNGKLRVSPELRARVLEASRELSYRPNRLARALAEGTTRAIGLMLPAELSHPFYGLLAEHVTRSAMAHEHEVVIGVPSMPDAESYIESADDLQDRRIVGLLLCTSAATVARFMEARRTGGPPVVAVGCLPSAPCPVATVDEEAGGYALARHLLDLGHRKITLLARGSQAGAPRGRGAGYKRALAEAGVEPIIFESEPSMDGAYSIVMGGAVAADSTAVVAGNDAMAIGVLRALHELGRRVPDDVAVAGFDNVPQSRFCVPALTTVDFQAARQAETAVELLGRMVGFAEGPAYTEPLLVAPELVVRESTARR